MLHSFRVFLCSSVLLAISPASHSEQIHEESHDPTTLDSATVRNLYLVGKVWGYLKYHHPAVTQGCVDWDSELLTRLPGLLHARDQDHTLNALDVWVTNLDNIDLKSSCSIPVEKIAIARSSTWIGDQELLGLELSKRLSTLEGENAAAKSQHYVSLRSGVGNPVFQNESSYESVDDLDWRYRILALYRFWNIVEYWSPYRELIDADFDNVLLSFIPRLYSADETEEYILALMMLTATVRDGHTNLWSSIQARPPGGPATSPFALRFVEGRPLVWRDLPVHPDAVSADSSGDQRLQVGDVILAIDGVSVEELVEDWSPYYGSSNKSAFLREIAANMLRGNAGSGHLKVERNGVVLDVTSYRIPSDQIDLKQGLSHDLEGDTFQELADGIAYVKLSTIIEADVPRYVDLAQSAGALIIDIRGYPKAFMVFSLGQHLVRDRTEFARFSRADLSRPGTFYWSEPLSLAPQEPIFDGPVVILVDEMTQSQAEYTAMAFRAAPNAVVIGSQTAGTDGNVSHIPLPGGHRTMISGIGVFYPDKTPTQRVGIVPDIEILPTISGIRAGKDEVLEGAIRYIRHQSALD